MPPIVIAESAILNTGHTRKSKKSITKPKCNRSIRLPIVPPKTKARGILNLKFSEKFKCPAAPPIVQYVPDISSIGCYAL